MELYTGGGDGLFIDHPFLARLKKIVNSHISRTSTRNVEIFRHQQCVKMGLLLKDFGLLKDLFGQKGLFLVFF